MSRLTGLALIAIATCGTLIACGGGNGTGPSTDDLAQCASGTALFSVSPVPLNDLLGWVPLGNMNPPGHTFPTNHQYLYHTNPGSGTLHTVPVVAPGNVVITRARRTTYSTDGHSDFAIDFAACREVLGNLGHIGALSATLAEQVGAFDVGCNTYSPEPGLTVTACSSRNLSIALTPGAAIGTAGGTPGVYGLDFGLWDTRVTPITFANPSQWVQNSDHIDDYHVVAPSDYYSEPMRSTIAARLGSGDGTILRTIAPLGGTIALDVAGTAQGYWFKPGQPHFPESPHLAFVPDNVNPSRMVLSIGTSQPGIASGGWSFLPAANGQVNRTPASITADGQLQCADLTGGRVALMQLTSATTLKVEARGPGTSCAAQLPWSFTAQATEYQR
jgi:hypothetical protein